MTDADTEARDLVERWLDTYPVSVGYVRESAKAVLVHNIAAALRARETQTVAACAKEIPTTWLDPLLSGDGAVLPSGGPWGGPDIERLLSALAVRIRALAPLTPKEDYQPVVVKVAHGGGGRGVIVCATAEECLAAIRQAITEWPSASISIERFERLAPLTPKEGD